MGNVDVEKATFNLLMEHNGKVYMIGMEKSKLEAIEFLIRKSVAAVVPTNKTQNELLEFLNYNQ